VSVSGIVRELLPSCQINAALEGQWPEDWKTGSLTCYDDRTAACAVPVGTGCIELRTAVSWRESVARASIVIRVCSERVFVFCKWLCLRFWVVL